MYSFQFTPSGDIRGIGHDADGEAGITGRWSGEGNVMFWTESLPRITTFCSSTYERTVEVRRTAAAQKLNLLVTHPRR